MPLVIVLEVVDVAARFVERDNAFLASGLHAAVAACVVDIS